MKHILLAGFALAAISSPSSAQLVVNEVLYDPLGADTGNEIIEIANLGAASASLSGHSVCVNSGVSTRVYWGFPTGTTIPAGGFLQVHWMADGSNSATDVFTGSSALNFSCAPVFSMSNTFGSVALYSIPASNCLSFGNAANIVDFMEYGSSPTIRESVAVAAGIWTTGDFVPLVAEGDSIAYTGTGNSSASYFDAACPTLGAANTGPGTPAVANYGVGCVGSVGVPTFVALGGPPAFGNQSFRLNVAGALPGAADALFVAGAAGSIPIVGCAPGILLAGPILSVPFVVGPDLPLPLPCSGLPVGGSLFLQWIIVDPGGPGGVAMSDGCQVTF